MTGILQDSTELRKRVRIWESSSTINMQGAYGCGSRIVFAGTCTNPPSDHRPVSWLPKHRPWMSCQPRMPSIAMRWPTSVRQTSSSGSDSQGGFVSIRFTPDPRFAVASDPAHSDEHSAGPSPPRNAATPGRSALGPVSSARRAVALSSQSGARTAGPIRDGDDRAGDAHWRTGGPTPRSGRSPAPGQRLRR
jgi:hypothetical protein